MNQLADAPQPKRFHLKMLPLVLTIAQLILVLNFSSGEALPPGYALSFNYGWPLQFYEKSLKVGGGLEFQIRSVLVDAAIGGIMLCAFWRLAEFLVKYRPYKPGTSENSEASEPLRFHLITWVVLIQVLSILLYLNITPGHSPYLLTEAHDNRIGWPVPLFNFTPNAQIPARFSITGLFANVFFAFAILYSTWWISEKIIELRK